MCWILDFDVRATHTNHIFNLIDRLNVEMFIQKRFYLRSMHTVIEIAQSYEFHSAKYALAFLFLLNISSTSRTHLSNNIKELQVFWLLFYWNEENGIKFA